MDEGPSETREDTNAWRVVVRVTGSPCKDERVRTHACVTTDVQSGTEELSPRVASACDTADSQWSRLLRFGNANVHTVRRGQGKTGTLAPMHQNKKVCGRWKKKRSFQCPGVSTYVARAHLRSLASRPILRNANPRSPGEINPSPSMSSREKASLIMASCKPRAPLAAVDPRLSAAAKSAVAAAIPTFSIPRAPLPLEEARPPLHREPLRPPARPSLLPRLLGCCRDSRSRDRRDGGSAVELRLCFPAFVAAPVPVGAEAAEEVPPANIFESSRSAAARPRALWGAAAAALAAVAGMASIAASRSAFLRHRNASVAGSSAGKRKFAVPTWSVAYVQKSVSCLESWVRRWALRRHAVWAQGLVAGA